MNTVTAAILLVSALGLPLLLALPVIHRRLPGSFLFALLPSFLLLFAPSDVAIELPWILWGGVGLGLDNLSRWWLAMSLPIWVAAARYLRLSSGGAHCDRRATWCLLTMAGHLGAILATDAAGFFTFSTLMGYAFFGMLLSEVNDIVRRAVRLYLMLMVLADIVLFEALLISATSTLDLGFASMTQTMALSQSADFYLLMVIIGFALKMGVWPLHVWLAPAYGSVRPGLAMLIWAIPLATGMLGVLRWLALGDITAPVIGVVLLIVGAAAVVIAMVKLSKRTKRQPLPANIVVVASGLFMLGVGATLVDPGVWAYFGDWLPVSVAMVGLGLAIVIAGNDRLAPNGGVLSESQMVGSGMKWIERWMETIAQAWRRFGHDDLVGKRAALLARCKGDWRLSHSGRKALESGEPLLQHWAFAMTLFLLLGLAIVILLIFAA